MPYLRDAFKGPRFDQGYPELFPLFEQLESGEVVVKSYRTRAEKVEAALAEHARGPARESATP